MVKPKCDTRHSNKTIAKMGMSLSARFSMYSPMQTFCKSKCLIHTHSEIELKTYFKEMKVFVSVHFSAGVQEGY